MMLDRRNADEESMQGIILLNLYSDDGLASIDNSTLWDKFMLDFKKAFDVVEKDPDLCQGASEFSRIIINLEFYHWHDHHNH
jgi:hypothetical protein